MLCVAAHYTTYLALKLGQERRVLLDARVQQPRASAKRDRHKAVLRMGRLCEVRRRWSVFCCSKKNKGRRRAGSAPAPALRHAARPGDKHKAHGALFQCARRRRLPRDAPCIAPDQRQAAAEALGKLARCRRRVRSSGIARGSLVRRAAPAAVLQRHRDV